MRAVGSERSSSSWLTFHSRRSNYEVEADEMLRANPPVELTPELWLVKLLMGGIDS